MRSQNRSGKFIRQQSDYTAFIPNPLPPEPPLCLRLIKEIHSVLLKNVRDGERNPGEFRKPQNWIGPAGCTLSTATFVPPPVLEMQEAMNNLETFLNNDADVSDEAINTAKRILVLKDHHTSLISQQITFFFKPKTGLATVAAINTGSTNSSTLSSTFDITLIKGFISSLVTSISLLKNCLTWNVNFRKFFSSFLRLLYK